MIRIHLTILMLFCSALTAELTEHDQALLNNIESLQLHELYIHKVNTLSKTYSATDMQFYKSKAILSQFKLDALDGRGHTVIEILSLYQQLCEQQLIIWDHNDLFDYAAVNKICKIMIKQESIQFLYWTENICRLQIEQLRSQMYDLPILNEEPLEHALNKIEISIEKITKHINLISAATKCLNYEMETTPVHHYTERFGKNNFHTKVNQLSESNALNKTELLIISAFTRGPKNLSPLLPLLSQHLNKFPKKLHHGDAPSQVSRFITYCQLLLAKKLNDQSPINTSGIILQTLYNPSITPTEKWPLLLSTIHYELLCNHLANCDKLISLAKNQLATNKSSIENIVYKKYLMALHKIAITLKTEPSPTATEYAMQLSNLLTSASALSPSMQPYYDRLLFVALSDRFFSEIDQANTWPEPFFESLIRTLKQSKEPQSKRLEALYNIYLSTHPHNASHYGAILFDYNMLLLKTSQIETTKQKIDFILAINTIIDKHRNDVHKATLRNGAIQSATFAYKIFSDNIQYAKIAKESFTALFSLPPTDQVNSMRYYYGNLLFHSKEYENAFNEYSKVPLSDKHKLNTDLKMIHCQYLGYQENQRAVAYDTNWLPQLEQVIIQSKSQTIVNQTLLLVAKIAQDTQHANIPLGLALFTKHHKIWNKESPKLLSEHLALLKANNQRSTAINISLHLPSLQNDYQQRTAIKLLLSNRKEIQSLFTKGDNAATATHCRPTFTLSHKLYQAIKETPTHQYYLPAIQIALETAITLAFCDPTSVAGKNGFHFIDTLLRKCQMNADTSKAFWYKLSVAKTLYLKRSANEKSLNDALTMLTNLRRQLSNSSNTTAIAYWWESKTWEIHCFLAQNQNNTEHKHQVNHAIDVLLNSHQAYQGPWRHYLKTLQTSITQ